MPQKVIQFCTNDNLQPQLAVGDLDGNGLPEVIYTRNKNISVELYWNDGLGRFTKQLLPMLCCNSTGLLAFIDSDGDGDLDVISVNLEMGYISTLINLGDRKFAPSPNKTIPDDIQNIGGGDSLSITTADLNRDGLADMIINNRAIGKQIDGALRAGKPVRPVRVFYNSGVAPFWKERTLEAFPVLDAIASTTRRSAGSISMGSDISTTFHATVADFNNDGWADIYLAASLSPRLFIANNGGLTFHDQTNESGVLLGEPVTMGSAAIDYNGDGWMDIIATDTNPAMGDCLGGRACKGSGGHRLLRNNHDTTFTDIGKEIGIANAGLGWSFTLTDLNLDGYGDFLVGTGDLSTTRNEAFWSANFDRPYLLSRNAKGWQDSSLNLLRNLRSPGPLPVVVSADFDGDSRPDLLFNGYENRAPYLLLNRTPGNSASLLISGAGRGGSPTGGEGSKITIKISGLPDQSYVIGSMLSNFATSVSGTSIPIGLGPKGRAEVVVEFSSGIKMTYQIKSGRSYRIKEVI